MIIKISELPMCHFIDFSVELFKDDSIDKSLMEK